jgi:hypothetical protein
MLCKCGCGKETTWSKWHNRWNVLIPGHKTIEHRINLSKAGMGHCVSAETINKIKDTKRLNPFTWTPYERKLRGEKIKERHKLYGFTKKELEKGEKISYKKFGHFVSLGTREKIREKLRGLPLSEETRRKMQAFQRSISGDELVRQRRILAGCVSYNTKFRRKHYFSKKNNTFLYYDSGLELQAFEILENRDNVKSYKRCDFWIPYECNGKVHRYNPDMLITFQGDSQKIVEVKSDWYLNLHLDKNLAKFEAARKYCQDKNNVEFLFWEESLVKGNIFL